jgi:sialidase-1
VTPKGTVLAICEGRKSSLSDAGDIDLLIKRSTDHGKTWNLGSDKEQAIIDQKGKDTRRIFLISSTDEGITWTKPLEITTRVKKPNWTWYATGPGSGIQLENGPHKGRLVIPCDHIEAETTHYYSHVIFSDDHGKT